MYQNNPADPGAIASLLAAFDGMMAAIANPRAKSLGSLEDAKQETIAALLMAARGYDLTVTTQVERCLMGDCANEMINAVRKGSRNSFREVPLDAAPERVTLPTGSVRLEISLAVRAKALADPDVDLLRRWHEGETYAEIAADLSSQTAPKVTPKSVERRLAKCFARLQQWAAKKKLKK